MESDIDRKFAFVWAAFVLRRMKEFLSPLLSAMISLFGALFIMGLTLWVAVGVLWQAWSY
jgi:hypothetical protein